MGKANKIAAATEKRRRRHFCHFSLVPPSLRNCGNRSQNASGRHSREVKKIKPPARPPIHSADLYGCSSARSRKKRIARSGRRVTSLKNVLEMGKGGVQFQQKCIYLSSWVVTRSRSICEKKRGRERSISHLEEAGRVKWAGNRSLISSAAKQRT